MARSYDLVIRGGRVVDGTGTPARVADVALRGKEIADVGSILPTDETPMLEAVGLTVAPGFVDAWAAADPAAPAFPGAESKLLQGVTTEVAGAGTRWAFPLAEGETPDGAEAEKGVVSADWTDARGFLVKIAKAGSGVNRAFFAGYGRMREAVVGPSNSPLTRDEERNVAKRLEAALEAGCVGLSVDLADPPAAFAGLDEVVELARLLASAGAVLALGLRDTGTRLEEAVDEALEIASRTGVDLLLPALRIAPAPFWHKIGWLEERLARAAESEATLAATVEPYAARSGTLASLLPPLEREGAAEELGRRISSPSGREDLVRALNERASGDEGYWERIRPRVRLRRREREGERPPTLAALASSRKCPPAEVLLDLIAEDPGCEALFFELNEPNIERMLGWDFVAVGSGEPARPAGRASGQDRSRGGPDERARPAGPDGDSPPMHPRARGTFARLLRRYVREKKVLGLEEAVRRMTSLPAERLHLGRRGRIEPGCAADLVVFRAEAVADKSTFAEPGKLPTGVDHVIVNGRFAVRDGRPTGARAGEIVRRS